MSLDQLKNRPRGSDSGPDLRPGRRGRVWLLPVGLFLGFAVVFALLFGDRLLPATPVTVAPVIALRSSADEVAPTVETTARPPAATGSRSAPLLFQASGWVEPDPYVIYVTTLINGIIAEVHVLEGQAVTEGQVLATLVDDDARLDLEEARRRLLSLDARREAHCAAIPVLEAQIEAARKTVMAQETRLAELEDDARRLKSLPPGAVPARDLSQALLQVERQLAVIAEAATAIPQLEAEVRKIDSERISIDATRKELETDLARKQLAFDRTVIKAPMDGIVLNLHAAPGKKRMLAMDDPKSAVIVELYDPENLQARIDVPLTEAAALGSGQPVTLTTDLLPNARFEATVTRIVGEADLQRNTLQAKVRIHDPDPRLRPGMLVRAEFFPLPAGTPGSATSPGGSPSQGAGRLALFAPREGLLDLAGTSARAWVAEDGRARPRDLTLGPAQRDDHQQVLTGLRPGDLVILPPHGELRQGERIRVAGSR